ncbi:heme ABC exporter ATP-binding protein CcmA [Lapidilactobacillus bayanensis]|uniref:heme ABC exporter ATP-binding protein CcmA n=1 Tax=Lapidilactobacillus bayanensis TaxID=2485998 RepID=UPI000F7B5CB8|nr:heme ABC exporter ATP-binding protein CcmA [Lapidilactobacillus bayanensis]
MAIISITNLKQGYGKTTVLNDINLQVAAGEILALIGPSGAGKTTLVSTIMGMLKPKEGEVIVLGQHMPRRESLAQIGYMAQSDALYDELTAQENLVFFCEMQGVNKKVQSQRIAHAAAVVNLTMDLNKRVKNYSGGMKRRLSLAIALISDPPLLILDEPTVGIDPELRQQIWHELHQMAAAGKTILLTTHVMEDAEEANQVLMIRGGEAIAQGTPAALLSQYQVTSIEQVFLQAGRDQDAHNRNR